MPDTTDVATFPIVSSGRAASCVWNAWSELLPCEEPCGGAPGEGGGRWCWYGAYGYIWAVACGGGGGGGGPARDANELYMPGPSVSYTPELYDVGNFGGFDDAGEGAG